MTKANISNGNKTKADIFLRDIFKSDAIYIFYQKILNYCNDLQNQNFSALSQK